ncbi:MAG TPA: glycosyl hydrolase family 28 protein, partial [Bacteroidales bacterium]|nr:glycosyl hydrolase family 28 protein [Bacteroidales bacterium]
MKNSKRILTGLISFLIVFVMSSTLSVASGVVFNIITDYGARGGGEATDTKYIQLAIDDAEKAGGGTVILPPGVYRSGTLFLKDNVTFRVMAGATLLGSPNIDDYTEMTWGHNKDRQPYHLIVAKGKENVTIEGKGIIDGNGEKFWKPYQKDEDGKMITPRWIMAQDKKVSPLIEIVESRNIYIKDVTIKTGGGWNLHLHDCDIAKISGINITNNLYSPNSDGIDITGCSDVIVSDCYIKTCDDAICIKTTPDSRSAHRITINNCIVETLCVGLKLGATESYKDITDVTMSNCVINNSSRAIGLYVREGGTFENINISNIVANTNAPLIFNRPIHLMVEKRTPDSPLGGIRNVKISDFTCVTEGRILMTCQEGGFMDNIMLNNITLRYPMIEDPRPMVEGSGSGQFPKPELHPGAMGARGAIVADNINNLVIDNLNIQWPETSETPDQWAHPERIENGSMRIHRMDYS